MTSIYDDFMIDTYLVALNNNKPNNWYYIQADKCIKLMREYTEFMNIILKELHKFWVKYVDNNDECTYKDDDTYFILNNDSFYRYKIAYWIDTFVNVVMSSYNF